MCIYIHIYIYQYIYIIVSVHICEDMAHGGMEKAVGWGCMPINRKPHGHESRLYSHFSVVSHSFCTRAKPPLCQGEPTQTTRDYLGPFRPSPYYRAPAPLGRLLGNVRHWSGTLPAASRAMIRRWPATASDHNFLQTFNPYLDAEGNC